MLKEINVERGYTCTQAMEYVKQEIRNNKKACLYIIHGYGSSGKGGIIRKELGRYLSAQLKNGKIKALVFGEEFNIFDNNALRLKGKYKELEELTKYHNDGVTIVEI